jgi:hypothetical protein
MDAEQRALNLTRDQLNDLAAAINMCPWCRARVDALMPTSSLPPTAATSASPVRQRERAVVSKRETRTKGPDV